MNGMLDLATIATQILPQSQAFTAIALVFVTLFLAIVLFARWRGGG
jgi:hypothetical protein